MTSLHKKASHPSTQLRIQVIPLCPDQVNDTQRTVLTGDLRLGPRPQSRGYIQHTVQQIWTIKLHERLSLIYKTWHCKEIFKHECHIHHLVQRHSVLCGCSLGPIYHQQRISTYLREAILTYFLIRIDSIWTNPVVSVGSKPPNSSIDDSFSSYKP
jgi:hypothetical protein